MTPLCICVCMFNVYCVFFVCVRLILPDYRWKQWYIIVPIVLMSLLSGGGDPPPTEGQAQGGGQAAAAAPAKK